MRAMHRRFCLLILLLPTVALFAGCRRDLATVGQSGNPVVFMLSPSHGTNAEHLKAMGSFLTTKSGLFTEVKVARRTDAAINTVSTGRADVWLLPLFDYLFCQQEYDVEAGLQVIRLDGSRNYRGEILVTPDSDIKSIQDLEGKTFAYVDKYSTSGFLLPAKMIKEAGVTVEGIFLGSHAEALEALKNGSAQAMATHAGVATGDNSLRVLATTDTIPNEPVFFRSDLPTDKRQALMGALKAFADTSEGKVVLEGVAQISAFAPTSDDHYEDAKKIIQAAGKNVQDLIPGGWWIYNKGQRSLADYGHL